MAGSSLAFDATKISNAYGWFWGNLAIPGAAARITLHTDGTPESVANPSAKHFGHTTAGWEVTAQASTEDIEVDEQVAAIDTVISNLAIALAADLVQTQDVSGLLQYLASGFGTYATGSGFEEIRLGITTLSYMSVALITPTKADATKFLVYNLYRSKNDTGLANQIRRKGGMGTNPVAFRGFAITSRVATDTTGNFWKSI
jgi:hypothetical protein